MDLVAPLGISLESPDIPFGGAAVADHENVLEIVSALSDRLKDREGRVSENNAEQQVQCEECQVEPTGNIKLFLRVQNEREVEDAEYVRLNKIADYAQARMSALRAVQAAHIVDDQVSGHQREDIARINLERQEELSLRQREQLQMRQDIETQGIGKEISGYYQSRI